VNVLLQRTSRGKPEATLPFLHSNILRLLEQSVPNAKARASKQARAIAILENNPPSNPPRHNPRDNAVNDEEGDH
jgi:hypothetical protein